MLLIPPFQIFVAQETSTLFRVLIRVGPEFFLPLNLTAIYKMQMTSFGRIFPEFTEF